MAMCAAGPSEQVCLFALDKNCHKPKEGHGVCQSCWSTADASQKEMLKDSVKGYCSVVGCFQWASGGASVCNEHTQLTTRRNQVVQIKEVKEELLKIARQQDQHESQSSEPSSKEAKEELPKKARQQDQHESQSSEPSRKRQKSVDGKLGLLCITAALKDLSTPDLRRFSENCIRKLASRAGCSVLS